MSWVSSHFFKVGMYWVHHLTGGKCESSSPLTFGIPFCTIHFHKNSQHPSPPPGPKTWPNQNHQPFTRGPFLLMWDAPCTHLALSWHLCFFIRHSQYPHETLYSECTYWLLAPVFFGTAWSCIKPCSRGRLHVVLFSKRTCQCFLHILILLHYFVVLWLLSRLEISQE
jgi:hypothetical protein